MKPISFFALMGILLLLPCSRAVAQLPPWVLWTLLPAEQMDEIVGEASGESAWKTVSDLGAYSRDRLEAEYKDLFFETKVIYEKARLYGLQEVEIVRFPARETWDGIMGELWETSPQKQKLASYQDLTAMLASGSGDADVIAELEWIGDGSDEETRDLDLAGKIVVTEGNISTVHERACVAGGALGVVFLAQSPGLVDPLQMPWRGIYRRGNDGKPAGFAFLLPPREGEVLKDRLLNGEKITVHARVKSAMMRNEYQNVTACIPGSDPETGEIIFSAHLFEGLLKQSGNDNASGCAAILEAGRTLQRLISEGRLPPPKRTIRFLWGPEFSGTEPWVRAHRELMRKTLCNINMDMVGEWLSLAKSQMTLSRTTYGNPHYINDVMENYFRYLYHSTRGQYGTVPRRIVAPSGADEPFHYVIETHTGGSDHEVFNHWLIGVPGISLAVWPDPWYHTSTDHADKSDPTQLKRVAILGAAAAYTIASADEESAMKIASEVAANAHRRLGLQLARAMDRLGKSDTGSLNEDYRKCRLYMRAAAWNEQDTLDTVRELAPGHSGIRNYVGGAKSTLEGTVSGMLSIIDARARSVAARLKVPFPRLAPDREEQEAMRIVPKVTLKFSQIKVGDDDEWMEGLSDEDRKQFQVLSRRITGRMEFFCLINGVRSLDAIEQMIESQYETRPDYSDLMTLLRIMKKAGLVEGRGI